MKRIFSAAQASLLAFIFVAAYSVVSPAYAAGVSDAPFGKYYADDAEHTFFLSSTLSSTQSSAAIWAMQNSVDASTDMFDTKMSVKSSKTDLVMSAVTNNNSPYSGWYAWEQCTTVGSNDRCEQASLTLNNRNPHLNYKSLFCHEIGHSLGLGHAGGANKDTTVSNQTCMRGNPGVTKYASTDVQRINARY